MDEHLSWDELSPFMDEVKALARGLLHRERQASHQTSALVLSALLDALAELRQAQPQWVEAIEHRFYGGLTVEETACMMAVDERTIRRWWERARLVLAQRIIQLMNAGIPEERHP
jgi:DNA-directed RNA polymerase specialized sigma24 family protein